MSATGDAWDDLVEQWHTLPDDDPRAALPLHEFLGLTWEQYGELLKTPGAIPTAANCPCMCWDCQAELNTLAHCGGSECLYDDGTECGPR